MTCGIECTQGDDILHIRPQMVFALGFFISLGTMFHLDLLTDVTIYSHEVVEIKMYDRQNMIIVVNTRTRPRKNITSDLKMFSFE